MDRSRRFNTYEDTYGNVGEFNLTSEVRFDVEVSSIGKSLLGSKTKIGIVWSHDPSPLETNLMGISLLQNIFKDMAHRKIEAD